ACTQMVLKRRDGSLLVINAPLEEDFDQVVKQLGSE
ncbi:MAG: hypothetical protein ACI9AH_001791, partial [Oceanospirillaceae bacterium]